MLPICKYFHFCHTPIPGYYKRVFPSSVLVRKYCQNEKPPRKPSCAARRCRYSRNGLKGERRAAPGSPLPPPHSTAFLQKPGKHRRRRIRLSWGSRLAFHSPGKVFPDSFTWDKNELCLQLFTYPCPVHWKVNYSCGNPFLQQSFQERREAR